jgi:two-component system KDP operon response regulator KdpE
VDVERHEVWVRGQAVELTPIEFNLLVYLMRHAGKVLSHRDILQKVWGLNTARSRISARVRGASAPEGGCRSAQTGVYLTERGLGISLACRDGFIKVRGIFMDFYSRRAPFD